ncbi:hypothetical protein Phum_PHUM400370 [Pediculus humanus corporis]|uniref:Uncharacterized protein n=1 Tax=Pediculus humanus subsp. corporis TaxID=121224 RepID=E0VRN5_PEDHC|nr:uncharacterized protein Phum_PHUM400370 [Pediculus humanus corporis]EEB16041.1 hypothetical protein Phum_PHUM400370 [Pediculus humanus corporis]
MVNLSHFAVQVNCNTGCYFDFDHGNGAKDYNLECNNIKNSWITTGDDQKGNNNGESKGFALEEDVGGCIKTSSPVVLNSSTTVRVTFKKTNMNENDVLFTVTLVPQQEGGDSCSSPEECKWIVKKDDKMMADEWNTIQLDVGKSKGKFELKSINVPDVEGNKCKKIDSLINDSIIPAKLVQEVEGETSPASSTEGGGDSGSKSTTPGAAPGLMKINFV